MAGWCLQCNFWRLQGDSCSIFLAPQRRDAYATAHEDVIAFVCWDHLLFDQRVVIQDAILSAFYNHELLLVSLVLTLIFAFAFSFTLERGPALWILARFVLCHGFVYSLHFQCIECFIIQESAFPLSWIYSGTLVSFLWLLEFLLPRIVATELYRLLAIVGAHVDVWALNVSVNVQNSIQESTVSHIWMDPFIYAALLRFLAWRRTYRIIKLRICLCHELGIETTLWTANAIDRGSFAPLSGRLSYALTSLRLIPIKRWLLLIRYFWPFWSGLKLERLLSRLGQLLVILIFKVFIWKLDLLLQLRLPWILTRILITNLIIVSDRNSLVGDLIFYLL